MILQWCKLKVLWAMDLYEEHVHVYTEMDSVIIKNDSAAFAWLMTCKVIASHIQSNLSRTETDLWRHRTVDLSAVIHIRGQWPAQEKRNTIMGEMMNNCCLRVMTEKQPVSSVSQVSLWGSMWKRSQCFSDSEELLSVFVFYWPTLFWRSNCLYSSLKNSFDCKWWHKLLTTRQMTISYNQLASLYSSCFVISSHICYCPWLGCGGSRCVVQLVNHWHQGPSEHFFAHMNVLELHGHKIIFIYFCVNFLDKADQSFLPSSPLQKKISY